MDVKCLREKGIYKSWEDIAPETAATVKYIFYDAVLALIGGLESVPQEEKDRLVLMLSGEPEICRAVWPTDRKISLEMAGFLNGYYIRYADWGDAQRPPVSRGGHPSDMCAAMLALCDCPEVSGKSVLEALHLAYQMWVQVQNKMMYKRPEFDPTTYLSITLPVMTAACLGKTPEEMQNLLNLSAASGTTLLQVRPADITNLKCGATGYAIARVFWLYRMNGFLQAPGSMFTGANGWYNVVADFDGGLEPMEDDETYGQIQVKALPCCNVNQASAECGIRLHKRIRGGSARIRTITVRVSPTDAGIALKPGKPHYPYDHPTADHHIKYCLAAALKYGALAPTHYEEEYLSDSELRRLIDITEGVVLTEEELAELGGGKGPCVVEIELEDGTSLSESVGRPSGYFVGIGADERNTGLKQTVEMKRSIIEKCYGYDLSRVEEIVLNLEQFKADALTDAVREAINHKNILLQQTNNYTKRT